MELVSAHGIQLTSYEVLLFLADSPDGRLRMSELADWCCSAAAG